LLLASGKLIRLAIRHFAELELFQHFVDAPVPLQRSAQAAITGAAAEPATAASDVASTAVALPAALPAASTAAAPESRGRGALRRPLVPTRPHRPSVADAPTEDLWHTGTLYASPYEKSPYTQPGDPE